MPSNFLPEIDLNQAIETHNNGLLSAAQERYTSVTGRAHAALKKLAYKAAAQHDDETDATNAAADLLEKFSDSVESNGDAIVASLAQQQAASTVQVAQVRALEGKVAELEQSNADLERGARRASNLQAQLDQLQADNNRLERELSASQAEAQALQSDANKPNPLSERVRQLEAENNDLKAKLTESEGEKAELQQQLDAIRQDAEQPAQEPDDQSGNEPEHRPGILDRILNPRRAGRD